jgi:hypothetical protein
MPEQIVQEVRAIRTGVAVTVARIAVVPTCQSLPPVLWKFGGTAAEFVLGPVAKF